MEHEVHVPVSVERVRAALADPARVARAVPGLQQDAGADSLTGRLKLRIGGTTITYRGTAGVTAREDGAYTVEGDATESRGTGAVKFALTLRLNGTDDGTTLAFDGTGTAEGRAADLAPEAVHAAVTRLLTRFAEGLDADPRAAGEDPGSGPGEPADEQDTSTGSASVFDTEVPPPSLDPLADAPAAEAEPPAGTEPPAEAAHARRTMIGRSAEEVDHAPPRGRYAPVPAPRTTTQASTLRWAAPAAALVVATVIVAGRALRRRR
ncbi:SRPBCC domain-containing protein [Streptomyces sp. NPDC093094]|uniref:SRPBCC domain-containing protein n=1 Tax=Streptomyces sp. NPDC093094 TaxID=3366026 RepID=UPI0037FADBC4